MEAALVARQHGADRIELCDNPLEGGTTPSLGMLTLARESISLPLFPIIRPRGGDFLYTAQEFEIMRRDILFCKSIGCDGVVLGLLTPGGEIDVDRTARLVELAYPMEVTFHRAFDRVYDPFAALECVIKTGCTRLLTSGLKPTAEEGIVTIRQLVQQADERIIVMPGAGLRAHNLLQVLQATGATEFHTAARMAIPSAMQYTNMALLESTETAGVDAGAIQTMRQLLQQYEKNISS